MKKWMIRALSALLIAAFLPVSVLADEYDLNEGSVTVSTSKGADGSTRQDVSHKGTTKPDSNPTITSKGKETNNTITIQVKDGTTANVTIKDTNISTGSAAIKTGGEGNVNLNVEGTNTVASGVGHAGVEKHNDGNLTIGSESGEGKLTANGGHDGAGIGGGSECNVSNITITGGEVTANGGVSGAGIGGGLSGSGSDITISGGEVTANGGTNGAGIGGGLRASGSDITISRDSQVKATGGAEDPYDGCGAAIGSGGYSHDESHERFDGSEIEPNTSGLYTTGKVERKRSDGTVLDTIVGTVEPPKPDEPENPTEPEKSASAEEEPDKREPLYRVLNLDGSSLKHQAQKADGVLALTAKADGAILTGTLRALGYLQNQGIEKITFTDGTHSAELVLAELIAKGQPEDVYVLTLGAENTLTLNGEAIDF